MVKLVTENQRYSAVSVKRKRDQATAQRIELVEGNRQQIEEITAEAASRGVTVTVICKSCPKYIWKAAYILR